MNVDGDEDKVKVNPGHLVMHNFRGNTKTRWEIKELKDQGLEYDPTREWIIPETTFNLPTKSGYFVYAKINMTEGSTDCTLEIHEEHEEVKIDVESGFLKYKLGYFSKGEETV